MNKEIMEDNKVRFLSLCREHIKRDGIEALLAYIEKTDFFTAPSSTNYHLNEDGGLCQHSLNVFETILGIYENVLRPQMKAASEDEIPMESLAIVALFHDLCKTNIYKKKEKWKKDESNRWVSYEGYEVQDAFPFGHGEKSCLIINRFIHLEVYELLAIRWHMGMFDIGENGSAQRFAYRDAMDRHPLVALLQVTDMMVSNCIEKTTKR